MVFCITIGNVERKEEKWVGRKENPFHLASLGLQYQKDPLVEGLRELATCGAKAWERKILVYMRVWATAMCPWCHGLAENAPFSGFFEGQPDSAPIEALTLGLWSPIPSCHPTWDLK